MWRIGHQPDPAEWTPRRFAFNERWDDPHRTFRTSYWADSPFAAFVELLAFARPGPSDDDLDAIVEEALDADDHGTSDRGGISESWLRGRMLGRARLVGRFCNVGSAQTIGALYADFVAAARRQGEHDFDVSAVTNSAYRTLTQLIAGWLYTLADDDEEPRVDGVQYPSRHGADFIMWAVFEQPEDVEVSAHLSSIESAPVRTDSPDIERAFALLGLHWT